MRKPLLFGLAVASFAAFAAGAFAASSGTPPTFGGHAVFCNTQYALCIKAYCPTPYGMPAAGGTIDCVCDIVTGWSMGPDTCADRMQNLVSTSRTSTTQGTLRSPARAPRPSGPGATALPASPIPSIPRKRSAPAPSCRARP
jgi:hypothetical protein